MQILIEHPVQFILIKGKQFSLHRLLKMKNMKRNGFNNYSNFVR